MEGLRVYVTRDIPEEGIRVLAESGEILPVVRREAEAPSRDELLEGVAGAVGLLSLLSDRVDAELLDRAPGLRVVANYAVGYDNVDVAAASERGIWVTNTPGVLTEATADLAFALLLACARRVVEGDAYMRAGRFTGWQPKLLLGVDLVGATLGIVGLGRIGQAVARRARGFGMRVVYHNRQRLEPTAEEGATFMGLDELLRVSDVVSLHCPGGPATRHMLDARRLELMKPGAILVNTGRGTLVDEGALVEALRAGRLRGAGLDVFEREPALHPGLADLPNVVLAPHAGSATEGTRARMAVLAAQNVVAALRGQRPPNAVNEPRGARS